MKLRYACAFIHLLCAATLARAGESPLVKQDTKRSDAARGVITRSDGAVYGGRIYTTRAARIEVFVPAAKKWHKFRLKNIRKMEFTVAKQSVEKEWKFREGGHDDKVYTGRVKLDRKYSVTVTYTEKGEEKTVTGRIKGAPLYVEHWDGKRYKYLLRQHHSGEWTTPDNVESSLLYTRTVDLTRDPEEARKALEAASKEDDAEKKQPADPPKKTAPPASQD